MIGSRWSSVPWPSSGWPSAPAPWTRRAWLTTATVQTGVVLTRPVWAARRPPPGWAAQSTRARAAAERLDPAPLLALAQTAVDAARSAGAQYADARFTRDVYHCYNYGGLFMDAEMVAVGVRALVQGYWGFTAYPLWGPTPDRQAVVVRLAREAVAQARVNAQGSPRTVALGPAPQATGAWTTPVELDPFTISLEEKYDTLMVWVDEAQRRGLDVDQQGTRLEFGRQERIVATSDGVGFSLTTLQSGGNVPIYRPPNRNPSLPIARIEITGRGWELFRDAQIPAQLDAMVSNSAFGAAVALTRSAKPALVGRYTLVCDGATMAALVDQTLGVATQLDRALGYEANAAGTSFLDDPLAMLGHSQVASPSVTVTANRTAPTQLATVPWDDEGVAAPAPFPLIQGGVLVDFQTTREQAAWLAPAYQRLGRPVRSHGCAAAMDASCITMQHMPNLALAPNQTEVGLTDLAGQVLHGILLERGTVSQVDMQAKSGLLSGTMREIKNGRLGRVVGGGTVQFNTMDLWKHVQVVGGAGSAMVIPNSLYKDLLIRWCFGLPGIPGKGEPMQRTSHSVAGVAAVITNQPLINLVSPS